MGARAVARDLAALLMREGRYEDMSRAPVSGGPQPAAGRPVQQFEHEVGFFGLQIRAVGYAEHSMDAESDEAVYVYVTRATRKAEKTLAREIQGVPIFVRKVGRLIIKPETSAAATSGGYTHRHKGAICCGTSIGVSTLALAGTMGAIVESPQGDRYMLSNNHVIGGCNHMGVDEPVFAPSTMDVGSTTPKIEQFAKFSKLVELRSGNVKYVPCHNYDVAIARIDGNSKVSSHQGEHYDTPSATAAFVAGQPVQKVGRTTRLTSGIVESKIADYFPLPYKAQHFSATANFDDVWAIKTTVKGEPFALPGDSGSLIVSEDAGFALGLLFAATHDGSYGFAAPISEVLKRLGSGFKLVSGLK